MSIQKQRVAINGFGRIGRLTLKALQQQAHVEVVAINDLSPAPLLAHLFKYDSSHGIFTGEVVATEDTLVINGKAIRVFSEKDPAQLPWAELGVTTVLEATGLFLTEKAAGSHLTAGAKRVVLSAPGKEDTIPTVVLGVTAPDHYKQAPILSNASCTTNCLAPMVKVLDETFGIAHGFINTVHAYTADQKLQDAPHTDWRRARAAAQSIIPTTTGAAKTAGKVLPHLAGKLDGIATRVPVLDGSLTDLTVWLHQPATPAAINAAMRQAAAGALKGIMEYTEAPLVSVDIIGNPHSCIFDAQLTNTNGQLAKVVGWYDNEAGYAHRTAELIALLGGHSGD